MRYWRRCIAGALSACAISCAQAQEPGPGKWETLFNETNLGGWVPMHQVAFVATNGCLRLQQGMGWLRTKRPYTNFVFEVEWRALEREYDSGFFIRAGLAGEPWPANGWQVNLARGALGGLVKGNRTVVPAETPPMPLNRWVRFRVEVRGRSISLEVDGERAWEYGELDAPSGYLGIQAENKSFEFRNLRINELK